MRGTIRLLSTGPIHVEGLDLKVGEPLEVVPVSEHEAALAAARQVDEAAVERALETWNCVPFDSDHEAMHAALLAALTPPEPEEKR